MSFAPRKSAVSLLTVGFLLTAGVLHGAVTYSGVLDLLIPTSFNGVYLDLAAVGGDPSEPADSPDAVNPDSFTQGYAEPADWDVNFFFGGIGIVYSDTFNPFVDATVGQGSQILNVATGTNIQSEAASRTLGVNSYGGSGRPNGGSGESHFDTPDVNSNPNYSAFNSESQGYLAFSLETGSGTQYGWMRVTLDNDGSNGNVGMVHDWAYSDDAGFTVGQIPEPSSVMLLLLGSLGLLQRRRRTITSV